MNVLGYVGFVVTSVAIAYAVKWIDPAVLAHLSRKTGLTRRKAWIVAVVSFLWMFLPVLAGAEVGDGELWVLGAAISGVGFFLITIAASSADEYRLLRSVPDYRPEEVTASGSDTLVATSGRPTPTDDDTGSDPAETPFTGRPTVYADWVLQRRERLGARTVWRNVAEGARSAAFTLGNGSVRVTPGRHRTFTNAENRFVIEPDSEIPEPAAAFLEQRSDLPSPDALEKPLRVIESYVPADEPVTVVGNVEQAEEPGTVLIDDAPADKFLGTHTDHSASEGGRSETILIRGDVEQARVLMKKRVRWLGAASAGMIAGGQLASFWLSSATLAALV